MAATEKHFRRRSRPACPISSLSFGCSRRRTSVCTRSFGSDAPIAPPSPLDNVSAALLRESEGGARIGPSQRILAAEALALHRERNPFASVCARVCFHTCEDKCRRTSLDAPVSIRGVKRFMADQEVTIQLPECRESEQNARRKIAIVGAGPAGLSCAYFLARLEQAGLVEMTETRTVAGVTEKFYRARADVFMLQEMILPENPNLPTVIFSGSHDLAVEALAQQIRSHLNLLVLPVGSLAGLVMLGMALVGEASAAEKKTYRLEADATDQVVRENHLRVLEACDNITVLGQAD